MYLGVWTAVSRIQAILRTETTVDYTGRNTVGNHEIPQGRLISYRWVFSIRITSFARMFIILKNLLIHHLPVVFCVLGALCHSSTFQVGTSSSLLSYQHQENTQNQCSCPIHEGSNMIERGRARVQRMKSGFQQQQQQQQLQCWYDGASEPNMACRIYMVINLSSER